MSLYLKILDDAEAIKRQKWAEHNRIAKGKFRTGASAVGSTIVTTYGPKVRDTEVNGLRLAAGLQTLDPIPPLTLVPNIYTGKKRCNGCRDLKPLSAFSPDKRNIDGCQGRCKACRAESKREGSQIRWKNAA